MIRTGDLSWKETSSIIKDSIFLQGERRNQGFDWLELRKTQSNEYFLIEVSLLRDPEIIVIGKENICEYCGQYDVFTKVLRKEMKL